MQDCTTQNIAFTTKILTLQQYIEEACLQQQTMQQTIGYLLANFGVVAQHYAYTVMYINNEFAGRCFCAITHTTTVQHAINYTIQTLMDTNC